jgi:CBS domain-containing protein
MVSGNFRHLPVMEGGRLVGMLSMRDVSRLSVGGNS